MPDQKLTCSDCGEEFVFTEGEQAFYAKQVDKRTGQAWVPPKRCKPCRAARKQEKANRFQDR